MGLFLLLKSLSPKSQYSSLPSNNRIELNGGLDLIKLSKKRYHLMEPLSHPFQEQGQYGIVDIFVKGNYFLKFYLLDLKIWPVHCHF
jgi:hypothetical protein